MSVDQLSKREQNKEKVREALIKEATFLFSTKGLEQTTVADIVKACQLGRGTFYNYYSDVKDIFNDVVNIVNGQLRTVTSTARANAKHASVYNMLFATFKAYFDFVSSPGLKGFHDKNQAYIRSASYKSETIRMLAKDLKKDINKVNIDASFTDEQSKQLLTYVLIGTPAELYLNNMSVNNSFDNTEVAQFLARLFTSGLIKNA